MYLLLKFMLSVLIYIIFSYLVEPVECRTIKILCADPAVSKMCQKTCGQLFMTNMRYMIIQVASTMISKTSLSSKSSTTSSTKSQTKSTSSILIISNTRTSRSVRPLTSRPIIRQIQCVNFFNHIQLNPPYVQH